MAPIPRDRSPDSTLALLSDGYLFISKRCRRHRSDLFQTRLMLEQVVCMQGKEAAEIFYGGDRFSRKNALPLTTLKLLTDEGSVQHLEGAAHRRRKQMFMSLMTPSAIADIANVTTEQWRRQQGKWQGMDRVVLLDEVHEILCRAACAWADVPLPERDAAQRTREFAAMIDGAGALGPWNWRAMLLRRRTERWMADVVRKVRAGDLEPADRSAARVIAGHRDLDGQLLTPEVATVELINVIRPTVAIARFVIFAALALHEHPACRQKLEGGDDADLERFVQEVRRFYPFFPMVGGRVEQPFDWRGHHFAKGTWVLFDLYGTNHDARTWPEPEAFRPERFRDWQGSAFDFVAQGAGDHHQGHRCPGEWITIQLLKTMVRLILAMDYDLPEQDLRIDLSRMPTLPRSRFVISNVRRAA